MGHIHTRCVKELLNVVFQRNQVYMQRHAVALMERPQGSFDASGGKKKCVCHLFLGAVLQCIHPNKWMYASIGLVAPGVIIHEGPRPEFTK